MTDAVIRTHALTKLFGSKPSVSKLSLEVAKGEIFGFIGPNGAGKTTTIRMLLGQIRATSGEAFVFDQEAFTEAASIHQKVGFLSGDMAMEMSLTGEQYLTYFSHLRGGAGLKNKAKLVKQLQADLTKRLGQLSRGNRQKIGLIAAVMHEPELLILDEPSSGFDPLIQQEFAKIIMEHKAAGRTALISSHVLSEVQHLCDRVGLIREGELIKVETMAGIVKDLFKRVTLRLPHALPLGELHHLGGIHRLKQQEGHVTFEYSGSSKELIQALAHYDLEDICIEDADLETLFMHYYEGK